MSEFAPIKKRKLNSPKEQLNEPSILNEDVQYSLGDSNNEEELRDADAIESFWTVPEEKLFLVETSPFIIYMTKIEDNHMRYLCEDNETQQICLEALMFESSLDNLAD